MDVREVCAHPIETSYVISPYINDDSIQNNIIESTDNKICQSNTKITKSKLWYFLTRTNPEYYAKLTEDFTEQEVRMGIQHQQNERSIGTDNAPPGISKICIKWFTPHLTELFKHRNVTTFPEDWETGIITLIHKSGG